MKVKEMKEESADIFTAAAAYDCIHRSSASGVVTLKISRKHV